MKVSDSVSDSVKKSAKNGSYGDGAIWATKRSNGETVWKIEVALGKDAFGRTKKVRRTAHSKLEAIQIRRKLNADKLAGNPTEVKIPVFRDFARLWLDEVKPNQVRQTTLEDYRFRTERYLLPYFGHLELKHIGPKEIHRWANAELARGMSTNTLNGARRILFAIMREAVRQDLIRMNPVSQVNAVRRRDQEVTQVRDPWSLLEVKAVLKDAENDPHFDLFLHIALYLGLRHGEILGLQWSNFDMERNTVTVAGTLRDLTSASSREAFESSTVLNPPKTKSSRRTLKLPVPVLQSLMRHKKFGIPLKNAIDYVFVNGSGRPIDHSNNLNAYKVFLAKNGHRYIRIHDLRHTAAVLALQAGVPLEAVAQALGHTGVEITKTVYAPYVQELSDKFTNRLAAALGDIQVSPID